jgi:hypothetical protein
VVNRGSCSRNQWKSTWPRYDSSHLLATPVANAPPASAFGQKLPLFINRKFSVLRQVVFDVIPGGFRADVYVGTRPDAWFI